MARNPKQDANLKKIDSTSRARELGSKGGKATAANKRAMKSFKQALVDGLTEEEQEIMLKALKRNAMRGNLPALEFLLSMVGEHPDQDKGNTDNSITININGCDEYAN